MKLLNYPANGQARKIIVDNVQLSTINDEALTSYLSSNGVLVDPAGRSFDSLPILFARAVAKKFNDFGITDVEAEVSLAPQFSIVDDELKIYVMPVSVLVEREARDVMKETCVCQVVLVKYAGEDSVNASNRILDVFTQAQRLFLFDDIYVGNSRFAVSTATLYGSSYTTTGEQIDGLYDPVVFEEDYIIQAPLVIVASRYLQVKRNG